uniref:Uncharacterized protein n=1 Tax=Romanomermis culicivorax TaxID=13658 RepID=A0A915IC21_ROMCU
MLRQACEKVPTAATQLKIMSTVKATMVDCPGNIFRIFRIDEEIYSLFIRMLFSWNELEKHFKNNRPYFQIVELKCMKL